MLQAATSIESIHFTRGGESHFCIGGYLPDGNIAFTDLSKLIVESLTELPTYIPQVTFRWTKKNSREDLRFMMDAERNDPHKRIAFTNDEKRIKCYTEVCGIPYERAVSYTTVGCNEPAFLGAITGSTSKGNILRCMERMLHDGGVALEELCDFDSFYKAFETELFSDLEMILYYDDMYNKERAKDYSYVSALFFKDCIENAKSPTQGGGNTVIASPMLIGIPNLIDSLIVIKEKVYGERIISLKELSDALRSDWQGYEAIRRRIINKTNFFGNSQGASLEIPRRLYDSLYRFYKDKKNVFGYQFLVGDLLGYNEHHKWFGEKTGATPDGRHSGEMLKFGMGQSEGRDKEGLSSLLYAIATVDENAIGCGSTVTNITVDRSIMDNDDNFDKLTRALETYFKLGGVHFQLTYVSKEELLSAQTEPERYSGIRVRVTGFSDYFVKLKKSIQDDIISRTEHK
jgi:formate C-acetyltransferase